MSCVLIFAFNLHPQSSCERLYVDCKDFGEGEYKVILSSDDEAFGGQGRVSKKYLYKAKKDARGTGFDIYLPARCAVAVWKKS